MVMARRNAEWAVTEPERTNSRFGPTVAHSIVLAGCRRNPNAIAPRIVVDGGLVAQTR